MRFVNTPLSRTLCRAIVLSLTMMLSLISCSDENTAKKSRRAQLHEVQTQPAEWQDIQQQFLSSASVESVQILKITNQLVAPVKHVHVQMGDAVKKDDVLISLDDSIIKAELVKSQAQLEQALLDLKRLKNLVKNRLSSDDEIAKAQTAVSIAQADVKIQQSRYEHSQIHAPFDGIISQRLINESDVLSLHQHLLTLINTQNLKLQASFSALIMPKLNIGDDAILQCGNTKIQSSIRRISPSIDTTSQQGKIEIQWKNSHKNIMPGQLCEVKIITQTKQHLMIPNTAIQYDTHGAYVFLASKTANKTPIITGLQLENFTEVLSGIKENDSVISTGLLYLSDGDKIKVNAKK